MQPKEGWGGGRAGFSSLEHVISSPGPICLGLGPKDNKQPKQGAEERLFWKGEKTLEFVLAAGNPGAKLAKFKFYENGNKAAQVSGPLTPWPWLLMFFQLLKRRGVSHCDFILAPRWVPESIRWMVLSGKTPKALKILQWVAALNGKKKEGEKIRPEVETVVWGRKPALLLGCAFLLPLLPLLTSQPHIWCSKQVPLKVPCLYLPLFFLLPTSCSLMAFPPFLCPKELIHNLQKEISLANVKYSIVDLFRIPILCRVTFCLMLAW